MTYGSKRLPECYIFYLILQSPKQYKSTKEMRISYVSVVIIFGVLKPEIKIRSPFMRGKEQAFGLRTTPCPRRTRTSIPPIEFAIGHKVRPQFVLDAGTIIDKSMLTRQSTVRGVFFFSCARTEPEGARKLSVTWLAVLGVGISAPRARLQVLMSRCFTPHLG